MVVVPSSTWFPVSAVPGSIVAPLDSTNVYPAVQDEPSPPKTFGAVQPAGPVMAQSPLGAQQRPEQGVPVHVVPTPAKMLGGWQLELPVIVQEPDTGSQHRPWQGVPVQAVTPWE